MVALVRNEALAPDVQLPAGRRRNGLSGPSPLRTLASPRAVVSKDGAESTAIPPLPRVRLDTLERVRREMARLYVEAKHGRRDVQDASRLANILGMIGRFIEGGEVERRMDELAGRIDSIQNYRR